MMQDLNLAAPALWTNRLLEQPPKSVKRFSEKGCGKNKGLEQTRDLTESPSALSKFLLIFINYHYKLMVISCIVSAHENRQG